MKTAELIQHDVVDELAWDPAVDSSTIGVTATADGVVTLRGRVESFTAKIAAEQAVKRMKGVQAVVNELDVGGDSRNARDDTAIARAAVDALLWTITVPIDDIRVTVENGWVTLDGEVKWEFQRRDAEKTVRRLAGVKGVRNLIAIKTKATPVKVKHKIEAAFRRDAEIHAEHVQVETNGGKVVLSGTVGSWSERDAAEEAAWRAPGVVAVENHIKVQGDV